MEIETVCALNNVCTWIGILRCETFKNNSHNKNQSYIKTLHFKVVCFYFVIYFICLSVCVLFLWINLQLFAGISQSIFDFLKINKLDELRGKKSTKKKLKTEWKNTQNIFCLTLASNGYFFSLFFSLFFLLSQLIEHLLNAAIQWRFSYVACSFNCLDACGRKTLSQFYMYSCVYAEYIHKNCVLSFTFANWTKTN